MHVGDLGQCVLHPRTVRVVQRVLFEALITEVALQWLHRGPVHLTVDALSALQAMILL